jgi:hypothetical protein
MLRGWLGGAELFPVKPGEAPPNPSVQCKRFLLAKITI